MTWISACAAAWRRFDAWLDERAAIDAETATWLDSLSTPEDHDQGIADRPGDEARAGYQGKHRAMPDEPVRRPS